MSFKIITDASCNLPVEMIEELGVISKSLTLIIDGEEINNYLTDERFSFKGFYDRLRNKEHIKTSLMEANLINDPVVTVEFMNLYVTVLGEVGHPGKYMITKDQITLLEALSMAGDLSIYGIRDGIYVVREENGQRITYKTDIRSKNLFASPAYFLKQNDVIYVEPNKTKTKNSRIGNATGIVFSAVGVLFSAINIVITIINNSK